MNMGWDDTNIAVLIVCPRAVDLRLGTVKFVFKCYMTMFVHHKLVVNYQTFHMSCSDLVQSR